MMGRMALQGFEERKGRAKKTRKGPGGQGQKPSLHLLRMLLVEDFLHGDQLDDAARLSYIPASMLSILLLKHAGLTL